MKLTLLLLLAAVTWVGKASSYSPYPHPHGNSFCPPPDTAGFLCFENICNSQRDCPRDKPFCCDISCPHKTCTAAYQKELSPLLCPASSPDLRCIVFRHQCVNDNQCDSGEVCCLEPACGRGCRNKVVCPHPNSFKRQCFQVHHKCDSNEECGFGNICCPVSSCGRECMKAAPDHYNLN